MADPVTIPIPADKSWTTVAAGVTDGILTIKKQSPRDYLIVYKTAGSPAPPQVDPAALTPLSRQIEISDIGTIDVYMRLADAVTIDGLDGEVVAALPG